MKGYSYPGKSPVKHKGFGEHSHDHGGSGSYREDDKGTLHQTGVGGDIDKDDWKDESGKAKTGEFFKGLAGQAGFALLEAGLQVGATALTTPRRKPSRKGGYADGFSGIQFGRS